MKKQLFWLILITISTINAEAGHWVKNLGDNGGNVVIAGVITDSENNAIICGTYTSWQLKLNEHDSIQNRGISDVFLIKYNPAGEIVWKLSFGGVKEDYVDDICIDGEDNIYITGNFKSNILEVGDATISSSWPENVYVAKFNMDGELSWFKNSTKATRNVWGKAVNIDADQNILITGYTISQEISFGDIDLVLNTNNYKGFHCMLDPDGNFISGRFLGDEGQDRYKLNDIASDAAGNIYLAGNKTIRTEPDPVTGIEHRDIMYISKTDPDGNITWVIEDTTMFQAEKILVNNDSIIVLGNRLEYRAIFNGGTIDTTSAFYYGVFDLNANKLWDTKYVGALTYDIFDRNDRIYIVGGLLKDQLMIGDHQIHRNADSSSICPIYQDIFILETNKSGEIQELNSISGSLEDIPTSICVSANGDLLYTGIYESYQMTVENKLLFNSGQLNTFHHVSGTYYDRSQFSFLARRSKLSNNIKDIGHRPDNFLVYPNPGWGRINIKTDTPTTGLQIKVHDINGKLVYQDLSDNEKSSINLPGIGDGVYMLSIIGNEEIVNKRVLILK